MRTIRHNERPARRMSATASALVLLSASLGNTGCGASPQDNPDETQGDVIQGTAYLAATRIWDDSATNSYFQVLPSIDQGTAVDLKKAVEIPGSAKLYASEDIGWFAIGDTESLTISRYTLDDRGALVKGETVSLQPYGVTSLWPTLYFVSPTKAYYPDRAGSQLIILNPTTMEILGDVKLPETVRDGYLSHYGYTTIRRGKNLLFSVGWFDWEKKDAVLGETGLVVLDTETDKVDRISG